MDDSARLAVVAEAICEAEGHHWFSQFPETQDDYRRMAQAAIDALQLTGETAFSYTHLESGRSTILESTSSDVRVARKIAGDTHEFAAVSRLVSPWVRSDA